MTRDEATREYEEAIAKIDVARERARITLRERLKILNEAAHEELKAIRALEQKTKRGK